MLGTLSAGLNDPEPVETFTEYAAAQGGSQVHDKPRRTYSTWNGAVLSEQWFYYDGYSSEAGYGKVGAGNVTRVVSRLGANAANYPETWMTYDAYGNITAVTDALGRVTLTEYDAAALYPRDQYNALGHKTTTVMDDRWGKPAVVIDPNGVSSAYAYDAAGRLECVSRPLAGTPCSTRFVGSQTHSRTATTYFEYDSADRVKKTRYPDGEWVESEYDQSGQPKRLKNNGGLIYVSDARYDLFGRPTLIRHGNVIDDERTYYKTPFEPRHRRLQGLTTRIAGTSISYLNLAYQSYTARGQIGRVVDSQHPSGPLSNRADYTYDALGRLTALTNLGAGSGLETPYA